MHLTEIFKLEIHTAPAAVIRYVGSVCKIYLWTLKDETGNSDLIPYKQPSGVQPYKQELLSSSMGESLRQQKKKQRTMTVICL